MNKNIIAVRRYEEVQIHFRDRTGNYATLCGLDGDDDDCTVDQETLELSKGAKVNCPECINTFYFVRSLSASNIAAKYRVQRKTNEKR
jgi:hypothetical protein